MLHQAHVRPLRILHISDLHERAAFPDMPADRKQTLMLDEIERGYVLGPRFTSALHDVGKDGIDLLFFTGDVADWGHPNEYKEATRRLESVLGILQLPKDHFFVVPGNHDVQRTIHPSAWKAIRDWYADMRDARRLGRWLFHAANSPPGIPPDAQDRLLQRTSAFWQWLDSFGCPQLRPSDANPLGYRHTIPAGTFAHFPFAVHVVGLDSAWLCGDPNDQGKILLTDEQVQAHIRSKSDPLGGFRVALLHHPLDHLADQFSTRRLLADNGVDLLLHGHQHVPRATDENEPGSRLRVLGAGCLMEGELGRGWPNGFHVIEVSKSLDMTIRFRRWSKDGLYWAIGSDIYQDATDGVLPWPRPPVGNAVTPTAGLPELNAAAAGRGSSASPPVVPLSNAQTITAVETQLIGETLLKLGIPVPLAHELSQDVVNAAATESGHSFARIAGELDGLLGVRVAGGARSFLDDIVHAFIPGSRTFGTLYLSHSKISRLCRDSPLGQRGCEGLSPTEKLTLLHRRFVAAKSIRFHHSHFPTTSILPEEGILYYFHGRFSLCPDGDFFEAFPEARQFFGNRGLRCHVGFPRRVLEHHDPFVLSIIELAGNVGTTAVKMSISRKYLRVDSSTNHTLVSLFSGHPSEIRGLALMGSTELEPLQILPLVINI